MTEEENCESRVYDNLCSKKQSCKQKQSFRTGLKIDNDTVYGVCLVQYEDNLDEVIDDEDKM